MQDKKSCVYVLATANNADNLPPELKRKGRFDEIFCVNLPDENERKAIFEVHLKKRERVGVEISKALLTATAGFNGADIESVVCEAIENAFIEDKEKDRNELDLLSVAKQTMSISKSCKKQIEDMKKAFEVNGFKDATTGKCLVNAKA